MSRARTMGRVLGKMVYWVAVVLVSLALVVALVLFLESRDDSSLERAVVPAGPTSSS